MKKTALIIVLIIAIVGTNSYAQKRNATNLTPLHRAAYYGDVVKMKAALESGADIEAIARNNVTPLHMAVYEGKLEAVKLLIEWGADPAAKDINKNNAYDMAVNQGRTEVAKYLESFGKIEWTPIPDNYKIGQ